MAKLTAEARTARLRLICQAPPEQDRDAAFEFGLQDKQQRLRAGDEQADGSVHYEIDVRIVLRREIEAARFHGVYVHGAAPAQFLYLGLRRKEPAGAPWIRRLKIPLASITRDQIEALDRAVGGVLEARVSGAGSGTVPLLDGGWTVRPAAVPRP